MLPVYERPTLAEVVIGQLLGSGPRSVWNVGRVGAKYCSPVWSLSDAVPPLHRLLHRRNQRLRKLLPPNISEIALETMETLLDSITDKWVSNVLYPFGFMIGNPKDLPPEHLYWAKCQVAVSYGKERLRHAISYDSLQWYDMNQTASLFVALQDYLNYYDREALAPTGFIAVTYDSMPLNHPYYSARREFILSVIQDNFEQLVIPSPQ